MTTYAESPAEPAEGGLHVLRETTPRSALALLALLIAAASIAESLWYGFYLQHAYDMLTNICRQPDGAACIKANRDQVIWVVLVIPLALVAAVVVAAVSSTARRRRMKPLEIAPATALSTSCAEDLRTSVAPLLWRVGRPVATARADGLIRRYIEVGPSWAALTVVDKEKAAAILRHEYAHHRSRDVIVARMTIALSIVVTVLAIVLLIQSFSISNRTASLVVVLRSAALLFVAVLSRSAVLRAREFDADRYASMVETAGLRRALGSETVSAQCRRWYAALAHHPSPGARLDVIDCPSAMYRPRLADALLVGLTAAIGAPVIARLLATWAGPSGWKLYSPAIAWGAVGVIVACWLVVILWNHCLASRSASSSAPLRFSIVLGIGMVVGNVLFSGGLLDADIQVPHHVVDVLTAAMLASSLGVGALWIHQVLRSVVGWDPSGRLFRGWALSAALSSVLLLSALVSFTAFLHSIAVLKTTIGESVGLAEMDLDSPFSVLESARLFNVEWVGLVIPFAAVAGLLIVVMTGFSHRDRWLAMLIGPSLAALAAIAVMQVLVEVFGVIDRAEATGWFAITQMVYFLNSGLGLTVAVAGALVAGVLPGPRVVVAGGIAALSAPVAMTVGLNLRGGDLDVFNPVTLEVTAIAVLAAMVLAAALGTGPLKLRTHAVAAAAGAGLVAVFVTLATSASGAHATVEADRAYYAHNMTAEVLGPDGEVGSGPLFEVLEICSGPVQSDSANLVSTAIKRYDSSEFRPETRSLVEVHAHLIDALTTCRDAIDYAQRTGGGYIAPAALTSVQTNIESFMTSLTETLNGGG
ncbi:hypothetical protein BVC93_23950 [Mycobacterium sp. MS1601]|uniref:M48 family metalloprotease n=1 Tax=Mycobacterium sp. MS1601 TaxID=1936029 RepID=UPI0009796A24|nr:M48 family metalloprotease [Mycobacterium sp. MS1601]AQA04955.1 hypothetical protein BVC93_23950 [Mycobacterium sp. MS1601]